MTEPIYENNYPLHQQSFVKSEWKWEIFCEGLDNFFHSHSSTVSTTFILKLFFRKETT